MSDKKEEIKELVKVFIDVCQIAGFEVSIVACKPNEKDNAFDFMCAGCFNEENAKEQNAMYKFWRASAEALMAMALARQMEQEKEKEAPKPDTRVN
jgi:Tfp pilus assembly PilM family ATPase